MFLIHRMLTSSRHSHKKMEEYRKASNGLGGLGLSWMS